MQHFGQIELFTSTDVLPETVLGLPVASPTNPHLLAARRLARQMRRFPEHSVEETRAGLAICRQLKAFLREEPHRSAAN